MFHIRHFAVFLLLGLSSLGVISLAPAQEPKTQPAQIRVYLPANATLLVDDYKTHEQVGPERLFVTPPLAPGKKFTYTLKATYDEGKRTFVRMATAVVEAGKETVIDMNTAAKTSSQIIYVPTPQEVVDKMLQMAQVNKDDVVFDLGCGDGRIVATAAKKFGAKGVGVDIDPERVKDSQATLKKMQVPEGLVEIRQGDALKVPDLSKATVVTLYMLPEFMKQLKPILERDLKPGTRVVAHDYEVPGWEPKELERMDSARGYYSKLYFYVVGQKK